MEDAAATIETSVRKPSQNSGGVKETIESILVAFILAFVFRAFVVEAFVIPTGSMATTLLGAHTRFHCVDCGYDFDVNYSEPSNNNDPEGEETIHSTAGQINGPVYCPNCGFKMPGDQLNNPPVFYGDRILVLKYLYLLEQPSRWDVVVFKAPIAMATNYIKRLIATPGEGVMVVDGDVYIRAAEARNERDFVIQHKPKPVQDAMWRLVYDNDFHPQGLDRAEIHAWNQPWKVAEGTGWTLDDAASHGRVFKFAQATGSSRLKFDPTANPTGQTLSEYLVYDQQPPRPETGGTRSTESRYPLTAERLPAVRGNAGQRRRSPADLRAGKRNRPAPAEPVQTGSLLHLRARCDSGNFVPGIWRQAVADRATVCPRVWFETAACRVLKRRLSSLGSD